MEQGLLLRDQGRHGYGGGGAAVVGEHLARFLRGGDDVGGATLTRFFGFHVAVLPAITTVLLLVHLRLVQRHGMSAPPWIQAT